MPNPTTVSPCLYLLQGKAEEAISDYQEAIRFEPDWPEPLKRFGMVICDLSAGGTAQRRPGRPASRTRLQAHQFQGSTVSSGRSMPPMPKLAVSRKL